MTVRHDVGDRTGRLHRLTIDDHDSRIVADSKGISGLGVAARKHTRSDPEAANVPRTTLSVKTHFGLNANFRARIACTILVTLGARSLRTSRVDDAE
jgi:hypothetical protein